MAAGVYLRLHAAAVHDCHRPLLGLCLRVRRARVRACHLLLSLLPCMLTTHPPAHVLCDRCARGLDKLRPPHCCVQATVSSIQTRYNVSAVTMGLISSTYGDHTPSARALRLSARPPDVLTDYAGAQTLWCFCCVSSWPTTAAASEAALRVGWPAACSSLASAPSSTVRTARQPAALPARAVEPVLHARCGVPLRWRSAATSVRRQVRRALRRARHRLLPDRVRAPAASLRPHAPRAPAGPPPLRLVLRNASPMHHKSWPGAHARSVLG